ncbi:MAG: sigma-54 dependent transcriptional regulator [Pseudomonadota bacterium]|nr:sigma-54 dependent transcriptional regulator [Pseudomonadota bacterium]
MSRPRVLVVDDDRAMCDLLEEALDELGFAATTRTAPAAALQALAELDFDVVVTDLNMAGGDGLALCARVAESRPDIPVIILTAFGSMEAAIGAIRAGAWDFLTKPVDVDVLGLAVTRAVQHRALREEVRRLRHAVAAAGQWGEMIGASPAMRSLFDVLDRVAQQDVTVMVTGASGTGKELIARAIHRRSPRAKGPFIAINCAAMPEALLESELFGHVRGAFTDARTTRTGLFFQASGGTLFLDEVGELPLAIQPKLLRALQERTARPVGGDREQPFDARLVVATNRDLEAAVEAGRFREDLYYRVNVVHIDVPPLKQRVGDVLLLAQHFLEQATVRMRKSVRGISGPAAERLLAYGWPGNVRELQNCMERAVALARFDQLMVDDLPDRVRAAAPMPRGVTGEDGEELLSMEEVERRHILRVLDAVDGSKSSAARVLGFDRTTLYRKLERYGPR